MKHNLLSIKNANIKPACNAFRCAQLQPTLNNYGPFNIHMPLHLQQYLVIATDCSHVFNKILRHTATVFSRYGISRQPRATITIQSRDVYDTYQR